MSETPKNADVNCEQPLVMHACNDLVGIHPNRVYQDGDIPDFLDTSSVDQDHVD